LSDYQLLSVMLEKHGGIDALWSHELGNQMAVQFWNCCAFFSDGTTVPAPLITAGVAINSQTVCFCCDNHDDIRTYHLVSSVYI